MAEALDERAGVYLYGALGLAHAVPGAGVDAEVLVVCFERPKEWRGTASSLLADHLAAHQDTLARGERQLAAGAHVLAVPALRWSASSSMVGIDLRFSTLAVGLELMITPGLSRLSGVARAQRFMIATASGPHSVSREPCSYQYQCSAFRAHRTSSPRLPVVHERALVNLRPIIKGLGDRKVHVPSLRDRR